MTDIEGFLTIYGHSDNLLNNNNVYTLNKRMSGRKKVATFISLRNHFQVPFAEKALKLHHAKNNIL